MGIDRLVMFLTDSPSKLSGLVFLATFVSDGTL